MSVVNTSRLIDKEVINVRDGSRLGTVCDVSVDCCDGKIKHIIVPAVTGIFSFFGKKKEYCIDWCNVVKIGSDIVLVDTDKKNCLKICEEE